MKEIIEKLIRLEKKISKEKGNLSLFALMLREDNPDRWDLLVSSPWFEDNEKEGLVYFVAKLRSELNLSEFILISRVVILRTGNPLLNTFQKAINIEHGKIEMKGVVFFGISLKHVIIITSKKL